MKIRKVDKCEFKFLKAILILCPAVILNFIQVTLTEEGKAKPGENRMSCAGRKAFLPAPLYKKIREASFGISASFTVEAALVLPIFTAFMFGVMGLFNLVLLDSQIKCALYDAGAVSALSAHAADNEENIPDLAKFGLEEISGLDAISMNVSDSPALRYVVGGKTGIVCIPEDDGNYVNLNVSCIINLPILFLGSETVRIGESVRVRKWTGYDPSEGDSDSGEEMVYITPTGTAYHKDRNCAYLNPSIQAVPFAGISSLRNSGGHIYYACPLCEKTPAATVYITTYGESYHTSVTCSGLKRTIYCVPISEVGGRHACSKCAGGGK